MADGALNFRAAAGRGGEPVESVRTTRQTGTCSLGHVPNPVDRSFVPFLRLSVGDLPYEMYARSVGNYMKPPPFRYARPETLDKVLHLLVS